MSIEYTNESSVEILDDMLVKLAHFVLEATHVHPRTQVGIMFVDEPAMEELHMRWMQEPGATDVLSFPMDELRPGRPDAPTPEGILGDIVICPQVAQRQAENAGHSLDQELAVLQVHGMLHLLGYDHATPVEEAEMFGLQRQLLAAFAQSTKAAESDQE